MNDLSPKFHFSPQCDRFSGSVTIKYQRSTSKETRDKTVGECRTSVPQQRTCAAVNRVGGVVLLVELQHRGLLGGHQGLPTEV